MTKEKINRKTLEEALLLAKEILDDIELSRATLSVSLLKASRFARLLNHKDYQLLFEYEASGYPSTPTGISQDVWRIAKIAGRVYSRKEKNEDGSFKITERANIKSVEVIEENIAATKAAIATASDPNISIASANPKQHIFTPSGNSAERLRLRNSISSNVELLSSRKGFLHRYIAERYDELRFSSIPDDIFSRIRSAVDGKISLTVPRAVQKFSSVYENLESDNPEDWANAVHSCRRILQDLADVLSPAQNDIVKNVNGKQKTIKLGSDNYINRLILFIEENSSSERYQAIVGSNLSFIGNRLDAAFAAAQKGSHTEISSREEADRYVVYTYMLVADILSLTSQPMTHNAKLVKISD